MVSIRPGVLELARDLIRIDTSQGHESAAMACVAEILAGAGFEVIWVPWEENRPNLVARWRGGGAFTLAAHLDTVPFDASTWSVDPLGAEIVDGRLYGRGSSDMKAGAAAMVCAAVDAAQAGCRPFTAVFTSAEETGCWGARAVAASGLLDPDPILIVGEATDNELRFGHKGATWLELVVHGRAAHGSRPDLGDSAVTRLAEAIVALREYCTPAAHPFLGNVTTNVGTISGGQQTNLVPDRAAMTVDVRTVPGQGTEDVIELLEQLSGGRVTEILSVPSVWTDTATELSAFITHTVSRVTEIVPRDEGVSYFTDGAVLANAVSPTVYIVGPGNIEQPHTSDEWCASERIEEAAAIYRALLEGRTIAAPVVPRQDGVNPRLRS